eukprot:9490014-Pyramimonas_sp.AAC.1
MPKVRIPLSCAFPRPTPRRLMGMGEGIDAMEDGQELSPQQTDMDAATHECSSSRPLARGRP